MMFFFNARTNPLPFLFHLTHCYYKIGKVYSFEYTSRAMTSAGHSTFEIIVSKATMVSKDIVAAVASDHITVTLCPTMTRFTSLQQCIPTNVKDATQTWTGPQGVLR
jgi:N-methylhydantoinase B/oxoprolinase/acetone carboxylase alpha subunit